jgi:hypothetical protein
MIPDVAHLKCPERLKNLKLPTLVYRRTRGDMIEMFKLITGKYDTKCMPGLKLYSAHVEVEMRETRCHRYRLKQRHCTYNIRQHYTSLIDQYQSGIFFQTVWCRLGLLMYLSRDLTSFDQIRTSYIIIIMAQPEGTGSRSMKVNIE